MAFEGAMPVVCPVVSCERAMPVVCPVVFICFACFMCVVCLDPCLATPGDASGAGCVWAIAPPPASTRAHADARMSFFMLVSMG